MGDSNDIESNRRVFDPFQMVYLLHVRLGYHDYYFCFHSLEKVDIFIRMFYATFDDQISSNDCNRMCLEYLTKEEFEKRHEKEDE